MSQGRNGSWEKAIAMLLSCVVIAVFIFLIFNPPERLNEVLPFARFLAAICGGIAASLFLGEMSVNAQFPMTKGQIQATGGFAAFVLVFFLFLWGLPASNPDSTPSEPIASPPPEENEEDIPILSQPVTAINSYLSLALFNPQNPAVPQPLAKALNITPGDVPAVFRDSPVFQSIQNFIKETDNVAFAKATVENPASPDSLRYSYNQGGETVSNDTPSNSFRQSRAEFESQSLIAEYQKAQYSPILLEFQYDDIEDARWTVFNEYNRDDLYQNITQYPQLQDIAQSSLTAKDFGGVSLQFGRSDRWLQNIAKANPNARGLVGYEYNFLIGDLPDDSTFRPAGACGGILVINPLLLHPYVKFIDIINIADHPFPLESITYEMVGEDGNPYTLTNAERRSRLFQNPANVSTRIDSLGGFILYPNKHYFIPIEFGFMPNSQTASDLNTGENIASFLTQDLYFPKPFFDEDFNVTEANLSYEDGMQKVTLSQEFVQNIRSSPQDIPRQQLAVGPLLNPVSIKTNNRDIPLKQPADEFASSISNFIGMGSCPYLLVYDSQKQHWINLGPVLYARDSQDKQATETYELTPNFSKLRIEEREAEITYLDWLNLQYQLPQATASSRSFQPDFPHIGDIDGDYLSLEQGDFIEIDLNSVWQSGTPSIRLEVDGFYKRL
jgi:hypothetical protein